MTNWQVWLKKNHSGLSFCIVMGFCFSLSAQNRDQIRQKDINLARTGNIEEALKTIKEKDANFPAQAAIVNPQAECSPRAAFLIRKSEIYLDPSTVRNNTELQITERINMFQIQIQGQQDQKRKAPEESSKNQFDKNIELNRTKMEACRLASAFLKMRPEEITTIDSITEALKKYSPVVTISKTFEVEIVKILEVANKAQHEENIRLGKVPRAPARR